MYGLVKNRKFLDEKTPFHPRSVYGVSKVFAFHAVHYRVLWHFFMYDSLIESPRRGPTLLQKNYSRFSENKV